MPTDYALRRYQQLCRRAEGAGYDGDITDLIREDMDREQERRQVERLDREEWKR